MIIDLHVTLCLCLICKITELLTDKIRRAVMEEFLQLELVQVNFRHGIRTPSVYEANIVNVTDPKYYGTIGFGQLTNEGKCQSYRFGQLLRKKYDKFLGNYEPNQLHAYTSKFDRTKMTLQLVLAGLYPPSENNRWHATLQWMPIPFDIAPNICDTLLTPHQYPNFYRLLESELNLSEEYQSEMTKYNDLLDYVEKMANVPMRKKLIHYSGWIYYAVKIHKLLNLPQPRWCSDEVMKRLRELFKYNIDAMSLTQKLKRLNGGTMVRRVIENIEENRIAENPKKIYLYSHHDLTLAAFERAQGIKVFDIPPFASAIILEKYRHVNNVEYVRFLAWDGKDNEFFVVKLKGCDEFYVYEDYRKVVEDVIPTDEDLKFLVNDN
ncbi:testicular acid phosphatase homolog [Phymastichus coffea]|uniref:testicular acid phosphatase homolog n=1 Tax=Phymastichus coffea TaxID=108790 RepID=UPI00273B3A14|nr:testicular acid phosphatase homolog [Phymastichus coffea]